MGMCARNKHACLLLVSLYSPWCPSEFMLHTYLLAVLSCFFTDDYEVGGYLVQTCKASYQFCNTITLREAQYKVLGRVRSVVGRRVCSCSYRARAAEALYMYRARTHTHTYELKVHNWSAGCRPGCFQLASYLSAMPISFWLLLHQLSKVVCGLVRISNWSFPDMLTKTTEMLKFQTREGREMYSWNWPAISSACSNYPFLICLFAPRAWNYS